jgi:glucosamine kinase
MKSLDQCGLAREDLGRIVACLALAGASEPDHLAAMQACRHPFAKAVVTTDAHAACVGAHAGREGGVIVVGTGSIGWAELGGLAYRVGGWGLPVSDGGSGAWLGVEALRRVLWAHDGRRRWTPLLRELFDQFQSNPHAIVQFASAATPREFGSLAPRVVAGAERGDPAARELLRLAAAHIDALAERLAASGTERLALVGGLAPSIEPWLAPRSRRRLVPPAGDALDGALRLARIAAEAPSIAGHANQLVLQIG